MSMALFAQSVGIKKKTFEKYVHSDPNKRCTIGKSACRPSIISRENSDFMRDVAIRADRANNGLTRQEAIAHLQELEPQLSRTIFSRHSSSITRAR